MGEPKIYPCCDDPECPYCCGSGVYADEDGTMEWIEKIVSEVNESLKDC